MPLEYGRDECALLWARWDNTVEWSLFASFDESLCLRHFGMTHFVDLKTHYECFFILNV